jgi:hypothetical protein
MIQVSQDFLDKLNSPVREIKGRVELYEGSTHLQTFNYDDHLHSFTVNRMSEDSKFFGFGICQKLTLRLIDKERKLNISKTHTLDAAYGVDGFFVYPNPRFRVDEVNRDENTNELTITAYCDLYKATAHTVAEIKEEGLTSYTIEEFAQVCARILELPLRIDPAALPAFQTYYYEGANYNGTESIKDALDDVAEATQTIYFVDTDWNLTFKRLDPAAPPVFMLDKSRYFSLDTKESIGLGTIVHKTELGDNVEISTFVQGRNCLDPETVLPQEAYYPTVVSTIDKGISVNGYVGKIEFDNKLKLDTDYAFSCKCNQISGENAYPYIMVRGDYDVIAAETYGDECYVKFNTGDNAYIAIEFHVGIGTAYMNKPGHAEFTEIMLEEGVAHSLYQPYQDIGVKQFVRDNPFWELRDDIDILLDAAIAGAGGMVITPYSCSWRGNFLVEIGDKIGIERKDGSIVYSYLLDDTVTYQGYLSGKSEWSYEENTTETATNPATLGAALQDATARVDKLNQEISLIVKGIDINSSSISSLQVDTDGIFSSISVVEQNLTEKLTTVNDEVEMLKQSVETAITKDELTIEIQKEISKGTDKVITETGYRFDSDGLTISKTNNELTTTVTENGLQVNRNGETVLVANSNGVSAEDLHATTFIIIGNNSRLETWQGNRTACFWIGD